MILSLSLSVRALLFRGCILVEIYIFFWKSLFFMSWLGEEVGRTKEEEEEETVSQNDNEETT